MGIFNSVNFIIVYGSKIKGNYYPSSDVDICISVDLPKKERYNARMSLLGEFPDKYDIQIFEDIPLRLKMSVLKGKLVYCKDKEKLFALALELKKEYEDFLPRYNHYITSIKNVKTAHI